MKKVLIILLSIVLITSMGFLGISCKEEATVETVEEATEETVEEATEETVEETTVSEENNILVIPGSNADKFLSSWKNWMMPTWLIFRSLIKANGPTLQPDSPDLASVVYQ